MSIFCLSAKSMILAGIMEKQQLAPTNGGDILSCGEGGKRRL